MQSRWRSAGPAVDGSLFSFLAFSGNLYSASSDVGKGQYCVDLLLRGDGFKESNANIGQHSIAFGFAFGRLCSLGMPEYVAIEL